MFYELQMLCAHLDQYKDNMDAHLEKKRKHFHQDVMNFETTLSKPV